MKRAGISNYRGTVCPELSRMGFFPPARHGQYMKLESSKSRLNNQEKKQIKGKITKIAAAFIKNKPNVKIDNINISSLITSKYAKMAKNQSSIINNHLKSKPNSNPIKANTNPICRKAKKEHKFYYNNELQDFSPLAGNKNKTNQSQNKPNFKTHKNAGIIITALSRLLPFLSGFVNLILPQAVLTTRRYVMKLQSIVLAFLSAFLVFTYEPPRPPVLDPDTVPFHYDPNLCQSEPLGYAVVVAGTTYENNFKVTEPEGNRVTISITTGQNIVIEPRPYVNLFDPNDSQGKCKIYRYRWRWSTTANDIGLHYVNVRVTDSRGAYDERTFLVLIKEKQPPEGIMGCHRR